LSRDLPWIGDERAWAVLVSEVMLQQTSTARVLEPWARFMELFPTPAACASAPLSTVLVAWSGLGYPRRAKSLREAAKLIESGFGGRVPGNVEDLLSLPGVGAYTAHAVASFAFGQRVAVLDTNVGRVLARALANAPLTRREAQELADHLMPPRDSASFNQALLDLGAQFCRAAPRCAICPVRSRCRWRAEGGVDPAPRSAAVSRRQPAFAGSDRQMRGRVLRLLVEGPRSPTRLGRELGASGERVRTILNGLERDGLITAEDRRYALSAGE
jgi:A/G-specific adenine glycosylase